MCSSGSFCCGGSFGWGLIIGENLIDIENCVCKKKGRFDWIFLVVGNVKIVEEEGWGYGNVDECGIEVVDLWEVYDML